MGRLKAGEPALKKAEVANIVPKTGRSGDIFVLTMRHTIEQGGKTIASDTFDAIYRPAVPPGQKTTATVATQARTDQAWTETTQLTNTLNFRYGGITWNATASTMTATTRAARKAIPRSSPTAACRCT
jgi:3-methylfumaryl-CoA hydratase